MNYPKHFLLICALFACTLFLCGVCRAQSNPDMEAARLDESGALDVHVDEGGELYMDEESQTITATGTVRVSMDDMELTAGSVLVEQATGTVTAGGDIRITRGAECFSGTHLEYNMDNRVGAMDGAMGCYRGINVWGQRLEFSTNTALFHDARASTCMPDALDYHIRAKSIEVTPDRKLKFKKIGIYVKNRRIFKWKSYTLNMGGGGPSADPGRSIGSARFKPPSLGYDDVGGVNVKSGLVMPLGRNRNAELNAGYYELDGFIPELKLWQQRGGATSWISTGKQYKENTGYFRYLDPVVVWNQPNAGVDLGYRTVGHTRLNYRFTAEVGRLKEAHLHTAKSRAWGNLYVSYPLNPGRNIVYSLLADGRYAIYTGSRKYRVLGTGAGVDWVHCDNAKHVLRLQYMHFDPEGRTYFWSDLVDTNDKLYFYASAKISQNYSLRTDGEFDLDDAHFDEVEYIVTRKFNCVSIDFGWRKEFNRILLRLNVLGYQGKAR